MALSHWYHRNPDFVFRQIADEMILVPIKQKVTDLDYLYTLNTTAARVWELLDGSRDLAGIRGVLASEFEIGEEEDLTAHLLTFVDQLASINAVSEVTPKATADQEDVKTSKRERVLGREEDRSHGVLRCS